MAGLLIRLIGIGFALIQAALLVRLILPFIDTVPKALRPLIARIVEFTDVLIAPFKSVAKPFDLTHLINLPSGVDSYLATYANRLDPAVVVAMIAWGLIGLVTVLGLRLVFR